MEAGPAKSHQISLKGSAGNENPPQMVGSVGAKQLILKLRQH